MTALTGSLHAGKRRADFVTKLVTLTSGGLGTVHVGNVVGGPNLDHPLSNRRILCYLLIFLNLMRGGNEFAGVLGRENRIGGMRDESSFGCSSRQEI